MFPDVFPNLLGWDEYPLELGTVHLEQEAFHTFNLDSIFQFSSYQPYKDYDQVKRSESPQGNTSVTDDIDHDPKLARKLSHNASERVRRKKISNLYSSLRHLLPTTYQKEKLSIPRTVVKAVEYIPKLQKEVEELTRKKEQVSSKLTKLVGNDSDTNQSKGVKKQIVKETMSSSISTHKVGDKEMVIQISSLLENISFSKMLLLLEKDGYLVTNISSFQSFGGTTFYNLHLSMEKSNIVKFEQLNEALLLVAQNRTYQ
ncbi:unnamed protein product [Amaranthus hypochondriacus]